MRRTLRDTLETRGRCEIGDRCARGGMGRKKIEMRERASDDRDGEDGVDGSIDDAGERNEGDEKWMDRLRREKGERGGEMT